MTDACPENRQDRTLAEALGSTATKTVVQPRSDPQKKGGGGAQPTDECHTPAVD